MKNQTLDDVITSTNRTTFATVDITVNTGSGNLIEYNIVCSYGEKKDEKIFIEHNISNGCLTVNGLPLTDFQRRLLVEFLTQKD